MMTRIRSLFAAVAVLGFSTSAMADANVEKILSDADKARGDVAGVVFDLTVTDADGETELDVKARGGDFLAEYREPSNRKGEKLVQRGHNMWFVKPDAGKPVPISPRQQLLGAASYGDIASQDWSGEYTATKLEDEKVEGKDTFVFDLKAKDDKAAYDRIKLFVDKEDHAAVKAEYLSPEGKVIKTAMFKYEPMEGNDRKQFIKSLMIQQGEEKAELAYSNIQFEDVPADIFRVE